MSGAIPLLRTAVIPASGAQQKLFRCPGCEMIHQVNVGDLHPPGRPRWTWNGSDERPTFQPSILVRYPHVSGEVICHSFVQDGQIQFLGDCTHTLAGQTVPLPAWWPEDTP